MWPKRNPNQNPDISPNPIHIPILKGGNPRFQTYMDCSNQSMITRINQVPSTICGQYPKKSATTIPANRS